VAILGKRESGERGKRKSFSLSPIMLLRDRRREGWGKGGVYIKVLTCRRKRDCKKGAAKKPRGRKNRKRRFSTAYYTTLTFGEEKKEIVRRKMGS